MVDLKLKLPDGFLEEEEQCGYLVTGKMKEIWAVELDLLAEFMRICEKHQLQFFVDGGTLLGTIRHKGFIPWDDDIDVVMFRSDYEKLCDIATEEFQYPYFFQTEATDPGSMRGHAQLRNSETTGILNAEKGKSWTFNQGIFIDIFPLDNIPDDDDRCITFLKQCNRSAKKLCRIVNLTARYQPASKQWKRPIKAFIHNIFKVMGVSYQRIYKEREKLFCRYNNEDCKRVSKLFFYPISLDLVWRKHCFSDVIYMPFEMLKVPVPIGYEEILYVFFGDWHEYVKGTSAHGGCLFDTEKSYTFYISNSKK